MALPEHLEEEIVVGMYDRGLLGFPPDGITLKSGRHSPYYYNSRGCLSFSQALDRSGRMSIEWQRDFRNTLVSGFATTMLDAKHHFEHVFGKAQAATSMAALAAYEAGLSYIWERVDEPNKTYGSHQKIEGNFESGETAIVADDVVTDGKSKIEGINVLYFAGLSPAAIALQFDREEGGVKALENYYDIEVNSLTTLSKAARFLLDNRRIEVSNIDALHVYHEGLRADGIGTTFSFTE